MIKFAPRKSQDYLKRKAMKKDIARINTALTEKKEAKR